MTDLLHDKLTDVVLFSTLAFFYALPAYVALGAIWRFSAMIGHPINDGKMRKWRMIVLFGFFTPLAFLGIILGIAGKGSAAHFQTAHSVRFYLRVFHVY
jgi:hypothetical protein